MEDSQIGAIQIHRSEFESLRVRLHCLIDLETGLWAGYCFESMSGNRARVLFDVSVPASLALADILGTTKVTLITPD